MKEFNDDRIANDNMLTDVDEHVNRSILYDYRISTN